MTSVELSNLINLIASITSIILACLAIWLSLRFFFASSKSEKHVVESLAAIKNQADTLQTFNARWIGKLMNYVTSDKKVSSDLLIPQLESLVAKIISPLIEQIKPGAEKDSTGNITITLDQQIFVGIVLYFYTAQTNYWCQSHFPKASDYNPKDSFHSLVSRVINLSYSDFLIVQNNLAMRSQRDLERCPQYHLYKEVKEFLASNIKSVEMILLEQAHENAPITFENVAHEQNVGTQR